MYGRSFLSKRMKPGNDFFGSYSMCAGFFQKVHRTFLYSRKPDLPFHFSFEPQTEIMVSSRSAFQSGKPVLPFLYFLNKFQYLFFRCRDFSIDEFSSF